MFPLCRAGAIAFVAGLVSVCATTVSADATPAIFGRADATLGAAELRASATTQSMERAIANRHFATYLRPIVGRAALTRLPKARAHAMSSGLVVNVPLGGDVAAAAGQVDEAGGGIVQLAAGTYHLTSSIPLLSNITIQGQGASTIIQSPATPHGFAMMVNASEGIGNIVIQNLVLDGNIPPGAFGNGLYNGAGIYLVALNNAISPVTISNVEVKNTSIGLLFDGVNNINISNSYIHDNNPGFFSHNAYFIACTGVSISHSRFDHAHTGDGLHFDFGSSVYTISKSEFNGNNGIGILDQGNLYENVQDTTANYNQNDGFQMSSNSSGYVRLESNENWGFGYNNGGGSGGAVGLIAFNDAGGFGQFFGFGFGQLLAATTANQYLAILATGPLGPVDTADWSTTYGGYSTIGYVDFNAKHLANGLLTFNVGAVGAKNYVTSFRYSNGTTSTLTMPITVNGANVGSVSFPPTGSWTTWSTTNITLPLKDGNNVVSVTPVASGAPELDYLQVNAPVPAPPAAPRVTAVAKSPYSVYLSWPAVIHAQTYNVFKVGDPAPLAVGLTSSNFTDNTILTGNTANSYVVQALNQGGGSAGTSASVTTPLDAPAGFTVSAVTGGYSLSWIGTNGATAYGIRRATNSGSPYSLIATVPASATSYVDATANPSAIYYYEIYAVNASGKSASSYELSVNTPSSGQISEDIGTLGIAGLTDYNASTGTFGLDGAGTGLYYNADSFHYEYLAVTGNVTMTARVTGVQALSAATQVGIDLRASLAPGDANVLVDLTGGLGATTIIRPAAGATSQVAGVLAGIKPPYYLQLARVGNTITSSVSPDDLNWTTISSATIAMPTNAYIGLAVSSTISNKNALGSFDTVSTVGTVAASSNALRSAQVMRRFNVAVRRT